MRLLEPGAVLPAGLANARELAWALKDLCYESWNNDPPRAARAAQALRDVCNAGVPAEQKREIEALAEWTAGIAAIIRAQMNDAVRHFDAAAAALNQIGLADPAAQTQVPKIMALSMLGQHALAAECAEAAQRVLVSLGNLRVAARVSQNLGNLQLRRDDYAQAARHYREAAVLFARLGDRAHSVSADIGLADALTALGDLDEAQRMYARARMRAFSHGLDLQLALVDESMALVDLARGRYREALNGFDSARRQYETLALPHCVAIVEKQLADTYLDLRLLPEALALFETAVGQFAALELPDEQAWALAQQGRTEALLGRAAADASLARAAALFVAQGNAVGAAAIALARAELALRGATDTDNDNDNDNDNDADAIDAALAWADEARQAYAAAGHSDGVARAEVLRAQALLRDGRGVEARALFETTLERAGALQQTQVRIRCLTGLGQAAQAAGDTATAGAAFEAAIALFEEQRRALPGDDLRVAFLTDQLRPYQELVRIALAGGAGAATLIQLERFRARSLDERLVETIPPELDAELRPLRERLNWLHRRIQRVEQEGGDSKAFGHELQRTEGELLERSRRGRIAAQGASREDAAPAEQLDVEALQGALEIGDALIEYGVLDAELFACVVTRDGVHLERNLARWPEVVAEIEAARFQIESLRHGATRIEQHLSTLAARLQARLTRLHHLIWAPLDARLASCRRVLLVLHAQLDALPFAALTDGSLTLSERFEIAVAPSARVALRGLARAPLPAHRIVALGETSRLPHTGTEADLVASLFEQSETLIGPHASIRELCAAAPLAAVLHLACHAQFRSDNPRFSALQLHDGLLTVEQAESLPLKPCTVVLSACDTGLAHSGAGDEMVGLVRAFLVAGAARVIASLWAVDDALTARFMIHFYAELVRGRGPAASLRTAQALAMREHPHPYAWAAFTLYGGW